MSSTAAVAQFDVSDAKIALRVAIAFGVGATAALANDKDDYSDSSFWAAP